VRLSRGRELPDRRAAELGFRCPATAKKSKATIAALVRELLGGVTDHYASFANNDVFGVVVRRRRAGSTAASAAWPSALTMTSVSLT
jgi:hypothetical protein